MTSTIARMRKEEGFTLIELMIVLVVLGILAGLILFAVGPFQDAANDSVEKVDDDTCNTAQAAADATVDNNADTAATYASGCPAS